MKVSPQEMEALLQARILHKQKLVAANKAAANKILRTIASQYLISTSTTPIIHCDAK